MAAARSVASRRRRNALKAKKEAYQKKLEDEKKTIAELLTKYDVDGSGTFDKEELRAILTDLDKKHTPDEGSLEFVMDKLSNMEGEVYSSKIIIVIQKYKNYMKDKDTYDGLFKKHDTDGSGKLEDHQLLAMMKEVARERVDVDHEDLKMLLEITDEDKSGNIEIHEVKAAMAEWNQMIEVKIEKRRSTFCVLL
jgi:Ca2+-binding EF-hand superfamily protein